MRACLYLLLLLFLFVSCNSTTNEPLSALQNEFVFSSSKIWAHQVNTLEEVAKKNLLFEGMELDLIYSKYIHNLYVAHDNMDTLRGILLEDWIKQIPNPEKNWYWFDMKNLSKKNADEIVCLLIEILNKYGIFHKTICESKDVKALKVLKRNKLAISYWVNSDVAFRKITGDALWKKRIERKIAKLKPNALSSFDWMHPLLTTSFPDQNILYWLTHENEFSGNEEFTKTLCRVPNVKVVLVNYDEPIEY